MPRFIPPSFNLPVAWMVDFSLPVLLKQVMNIDDVVIKPEDLNQLRRLRKERLLYLSNHPSTGEPAVAYYVANRMGSRFHYMASRQVFDWGYGVIGKFIQSLGAFSVLPGSSDRDAVKTSRKILSAPAGKLVVFPEGEPTSGENDNLMPFQAGIAQLGFWALEDARKTDPQAEIFVQPTFVKYIISGTDVSIKAELHDSLKKLERRYRIDPGNKNLLRRFLTLGRVLLEAAEKEYHIPQAATDDFDYRVGRVRHTILDGVADRLRLEHFDRRADAIIKLRHLLSALEMCALGFTDRGVPQLNASELQWAHRECGKAYDFIVIKPGYLTEYPSAERLFEWLDRYEAYAYGKHRTRPRTAHVLMSTPVRLSRYYDAYKQNRRNTVEDFTSKLRTIIEQLRVKGMQLSQPIVRPGDTGVE